MARLYADEHIPLAVVSALNRQGHDVVRALQVFGEGVQDTIHFQRARADRRVLLTQDADFLRLSAQLLSEGGHHSGIVYWPQSTYSIGEVIRRLIRFLETTSEDSRQDLVRFL